MDFYDDLVVFLNDLDDFFIEIEGHFDKLKKFIEKNDLGISVKDIRNTEGLCVLDDEDDKWGLEYRLYTNDRPHSLLRNEFHRNPDYIHHPEYKYRLSKKYLIKPLLFDGFDLGRN